MKQIISTLILLFGFGSFMLAQTTFTITPTTASLTTPATEYDSETHVEIMNTSSAPISIKWTRTIVDLSQGCQIQVCDPVACFASWVETHTYTAQPQDLDSLIVHMLNPVGNPCCAIVHLAVTDIATADTVTVAFLFNECASSTGVVLPAANVRLFPNPVTNGFFQLENAQDVSTIRIVDLSGRNIGFFEATPNQQYNMGTQVVGTCFVILQDKNGNAFQVIEVKK